MARPSKSVKRADTALTAGMTLPRTPQEHRFCKAWLTHYNAAQAAREAGYAEVSVKKNGGAAVFRRFERYLMQQKSIKEKVVARELVLEQKTILEEMMAIGFANAQDYIAVVMEEVEQKDAAGAVRKVRVRRERQRPIMDLSRRQAAAISKVTFHPDGRVTYELPDEKSKHPYLRDLGQHIGLFHPKLIQEHRHAHAVAMLDLRDMDPAKLAQAEQLFISALGNEGKRLLNIEADDGDVTED